MKRFYTGIGSRETPPEVLRSMTDLARELSAKGYTLRSGGAPGADSAFAAGAERADIYHPWRGFSDVHPRHRALHAPSEAAFELAQKRIPRFETFGQGVQKLLARNMHQVLGSSLRSPSSFVVCWTPGGKDVGGTRHAIALARDHKVPVVNLATADVEAVYRLVSEEAERAR